MHQYETILIIDPNIESEASEALVDNVKNLITNDGGVISKTENWGKKKLAYEIKGNKDGLYVLLRYEANPNLIQRLERYFVLNEQIIKYLTVRAEKLPEPRQKEISIRKFEEEEEDFIQEDFEYESDDEDMDEDVDSEDEDSEFEYYEEDEE